MLGAGVAWGIYSLRGKGTGNPTAVTAGNFLRAVPLAAALSAAMSAHASIDSAGFWYATGSGAVASGIGYAIWYAALPGLKAGNAATVQLSVPVIATLGAVVFLGESVTHPNRAGLGSNPRRYCPGCGALGNPARQAGVKKHGKPARLARRCADGIGFSFIACLPSGDGVHIFKVWYRSCPGDCHHELQSGGTLTGSLRVQGALPALDRRGSRQRHVQVDSRVSL